MSVSLARRLSVLSIFFLAISGVYGTVTNVDMGDNHNRCQLEVVQDATVYPSNQGSSTFLIVGIHSGFSLKRTLIEFDDATGCTCNANSIYSARMYLYWYYSHKPSWTSADTNPHIGKTFEVYQVLKDWDESSMTSTSTGVGGNSWNTAYLGTNNIDAKSTTGGNGLEFEPSFYQWLEFDVTDIVKNWYDNGDSNYGILIKQNDESNTARTQRFYSKEYSNGDYAPRLYVFCENT